MVMVVLLFKIGLGRLRSGSGEGAWVCAGVPRRCDGERVTDAAGN